MSIIKPLDGNEEFQMTGLTAEDKQAIKLDAVKRNVPASAVLVAAWREYTKRNPI